VLATRRDGRATQQSPVLVKVDAEGRAIVSSRETALKTRNLRRRSAVGPGGLRLLATVPSGGAQPVSLTVHHGLLCAARLVRLPAGAVAAHERPGGAPLNAETDRRRDLIRPPKNWKESITGRRAPRALHADRRG